MKYACPGRDCPKRPPVAAVDPPTCYTCGRKMSAVVVVSMPITFTPAAPSDFVSYEKNQTKCEEIVPHFAWTETGVRQLIEYATGLKVTSFNVRSVSPYEAHLEATVPGADPARAQRAWELLLKNKPAGFVITLSVLFGIGSGISSFFEEKQ